MCGNHSMLRSTFLFALAFLFVLLGAASSASAQADSDISNCKNPHVENLTGIRFPMKNDQGIEEMRMILTGAPDRPVRIDCEDMHLSADQMEVFDNHRVVATGNVLFESQSNRIASERLEFDTKTRTGTFYNASGTVSMANRVDRSMFGTQEPDAMFRGDEVHKLGPDTYKIVHGAFTTCVQPTPRWEMVGGSVTLKVHDHAFLTNSTLRVKGVPIMYLPAFYYPVQDDDRATGFLIPIYGASTVRGQSLSNAFFWAIDRSQDATFLYDWYSKTGQAFGSEYRYELGGGNHGNAQFNLLDEHSADYQQSDGSVKTTNAATNFAMRGALSQKLGARAACPRERQLHLGSRGPAALSAERSADEQPHQDHRRERDGQLERQRPERHHRQERHLLRREQPVQHRWTAADLVQSWRAPDRQVQDLLRREHRVRHSNLQDRYRKEKP